MEQRNDPLKLKLEKAKPLRGGKKGEIEEISNTASFQIPQTMAKHTILLTFLFATLFMTVRI